MQKQDDLQVKRQASMAEAGEREGPRGSSVKPQRVRGVYTVKS